MIALVDPPSAIGGGVKEKLSGRRHVVTLGFFDCLHLGHRKLIEDLSSWAREVRGAPAVVTFDRHPLEVLGRRPPMTVSTLEERLIHLARAGVETALVLPFDRAVASWSPEEFLRRIRDGVLSSRDLLLGFDSAFGRDRRGTYDDLKRREGELGITVRRSEPFLLDGQRISSTLIREAVAAGDLRRLERYLGRPFSILGTVIEGARRGRLLGFPTANLLSPSPIQLPPGVYCARVGVLPSPRNVGGLTVIPGETVPCVPAVVNLGIRPTFDPPNRAPLAEAHLLDFEGDLYGSLLEVQFLEFLRAEKRFTSSEELVKQIQQDIATCRSIPEHGSEPRTPG